MGLQNGRGIKQLTRLLPEGVAAPAAWLAANGYSRQLVRQYVLAACRSIKIKRIFLFLAGHFDYPWAKRIKADGLDLGRGNRQVVKGGGWTNVF